MVQYGLPDGTDYNSGPWTVTGAATLHQALDEGAASHDGNTTRAETANQGDSFRVTLSSMVDPHIHTGHIMRMVVRGTGDVPGGPPAVTTDIVRYLIKQGPGAPPGNITYFDGGLYRGYQTWSHTLSEAEAALITDYDGLEIQFHYLTKTGSTIAVVTALEFEVPDPGHIYGDAEIEVETDGLLQRKDKIDGDAEVQIDADATATGKGVMTGDTEVEVQADGALGAIGVLIGDTQIVISLDGTVTGVSKLVADAEIALDLVGILIGKSGMVGDTEIEIGADATLTGKAALAGDTEIDIDAPPFKQLNFWDDAPAPVPGTGMLFEASLNESTEAASTLSMLLEFPTPSGQGHLFSGAAYPKLDSWPSGNSTVVTDISNYSGVASGMEMRAAVWRAGSDNTQLEFGGYSSWQDITGEGVFSFDCPYPGGGWGSSGPAVQSSDRFMVVLYVRNIGGSGDVSCDVNVGDGSSYVETPVVCLPQLTGKAALAGDTEIDIDADATPTGKGAMAGDTEIDIDADATLTGKAALAGDTEIEIDADATLTGGGVMAGDTEIDIDADATLTGTGVMVGDTEIQVDLDGTLAGAGGMTGNADIRVDLDGIATAIGAMQGSTEVEITLDGELTGVVTEPPEPGGSTLFINGAAVVLELVSQATAVQVLRKSGTIGGAHNATPISLMVRLPASVVQTYLRRALLRDDS